LIQIPSLLSRAECAAICEIVSQDSMWRDGGHTARGHARAVKNNLQADDSQPSVRGALTKIQDTLLAQDVFKAYTQPATLVRVMINQYGPGMSYGDHVDAPYIDSLRTDLSFTLFLSDPASYSGGDLVIDASGVQDTIKLDQGSVIVYPARRVHRVNPVTHGERIACVGWVKSRVRSETMRETLFDLESMIASLDDTEISAAQRIRLTNIRNNLLREVGE